MELVSTNGHAAVVTAPGTAMDTSVSVSGHLMEMLATVYSYILLAAIREAVQNACDAARRNGLTVRDGVLVMLPTRENPVITVIDRGQGMTHQFMSTKYLSWGTSTKTADNDSAGGLGIGRWAAYGYIREAYITTCHQDEMIERTYFQFQGTDGTPKVQMASETLGEVAGTRVFFPVKETDLTEAYRAVAWLQEVMQLTMGDSFSVDMPSLLPTMLPKSSGLAFDLGSDDPSLAGVIVHPMQGSDLQYSRTGSSEGSIVVLTNKAAGVGGLPFHVNTEVESVFAYGTVIEIPMSFRVAFLPSREEVKYTDEFVALMARISTAAMKVGIAKAAELYAQPTLTSKRLLSQFLGTACNWHVWARASRLQTEWTPRLRAATGGRPWSGQLVVSAPVSLKRSAGNCKLQLVNHAGSMTTVVPLGTTLAFETGSGSRTVMHNLSMTTQKPLVLVYNDLSSGGISRFRQWKLENPKPGQLLYINADTKGLAEEVATELSAMYGGELVVIPTSVLPPVARVVVGGTVRRKSGVDSLSYYCCANKRIESSPIGFDSVLVTEPVKVWLVKNGGELSGFSSTCGIRDLTEIREPYSLGPFLKSTGLTRLYLLTDKQAKALAAEKQAAVDAGFWDLDAAEFSDDEASQDMFQAVRGLKEWMSFDEFLQDLINRKELQEVLNGTRIQSVTPDANLDRFCTVTARAPRLELSGTKLDAKLSPYVDVISGHIKLLRDTAYPEKWLQWCRGLKFLTKHLVATETDTPERTQLLEDLKNLSTSGHLNYSTVWASLIEEFPLLSIANSLGPQVATSHYRPSPVADHSEAATNHYYAALAVLYR